MLNPGRELGQRCWFSQHPHWHELRDVPRYLAKDSEHGHPMMECLEALSYVLWEWTNLLKSNTREWRSGRCLQTCIDHASNRNCKQRDDIHLITRGRNLPHGHSDVYRGYKLSPGHLRHLASNLSSATDLNKLMEQFILVSQTVRCKEEKDLLFPVFSLAVNVIIALSQPLLEIEFRNLCLLGKHPLGLTSFLSPCLFESGSCYVMQLVSDS